MDGPGVIAADALALALPVVALRMSSVPLVKVLFVPGVMSAVLLLMGTIPTVLLMVTGRMLAEAISVGVGVGVGVTR